MCAIPSSGSQQPIHVLVAVAVRLYREGIVAGLKGRDNLRVVGVAKSLDEALGATRASRVDVALVDVSQRDARLLIQSLRTQSAFTRIVAFAVSEDLATVLSFAEAGASGFVDANGTLDELVSAIERTSVGDLPCSPKITAQLLARAVASVQPGGDSSGQNLTRRELQVLTLLKQGCSNKEIARELYISLPTVKNHVHHLLEKLCVRTRSEAIARVFQPRAEAVAEHERG